jgi:hypothetical protein
MPCIMLKIKLWYYSVFCILYYAIIVRFFLFFIILCLTRYIYRLYISSSFHFHHLDLSTNFNSLYNIWFNTAYYIYIYNYYRCLLDALLILLYFILNPFYPFFLCYTFVYLKDLFFLVTILIVILSPCFYCKHISMV